MKRILLSLLLWGAGMGAALTGVYAASPQGPLADTAKPKKPTPFDEKVKSSKQTPGLFTLYQDTTTGTMQLYVKKQQLGEEFIYQSFSLSGPTSLYLNQSMHRA